MNYFVWNCLTCFSNTKIGSVTSFSILFNFQGPVRLSLAADDLFILPLKWFFVKPYFLEAFELSELGVLQTSQCQLVFSASIGSFQGLPAVASEVILLPQRLALKYNTTPPPPCQHFLTDFFHSFLRSPQNSSKPPEKLRRSSVSLFIYIMYYKAFSV